MASQFAGKVITALGPIEPGETGAVLMHEHCYVDLNVAEEGPTPPERVELLRAYCAPFLNRLAGYGSYAICDPTPSPMRAEPWVYQELARLSGCHIILATGFYREAAADEARPCGGDIAHRWLDRRLLKGDVGLATEFMRAEFDEGIHGSAVRPGIIKLGSTLPEFTPGERTAFLAGARVQRATGLAITTHANGLGVAPAQLDLLESGGANPSRVILGHTARDIVEAPDQARQLMQRGATLLPTNLRMDSSPSFYRNLVVGINALFDAGLGDRLVLGLDWGFENENGPFMPCSFMPPPPYIYMFTHTLPRLRELGLREEAIETMLVRNPARLLALAAH